MRNIYPSAVFVALSGVEGLKFMCFDSAQHDKTFGNVLGYKKNLPVL